MTNSDSVVHGLKTHPEYFEEVRSGNKTCEVRYNDRHYAAGDILNLREWNPVTEQYTGRSLIVLVYHILDQRKWGITHGYVVLSIQKLNCGKWDK